MVHTVKLNDFETISANPSPAQTQPKKPALSQRPLALNPLTRSASRLSGPVLRPDRPASGLDWLEKMAPAGMKPRIDPDAKKKEEEQKKQLERLANLDKQRSRQMYEEIQKQIQLARQKKQSQPPSP